MQNQTIPNPTFFKTSNQSVLLSPANKFSNDNQFVSPNAENNSFTMAPGQIITGQPKYSYSPATKSKMVPVVAQYVPDNRLESVPTHHTYLERNQQIQQRIIMDEPQSFPPRIAYTSIQAKTPVFQSFQQQKPVATVPIEENSIAQTPIVDLKPATVVYDNHQNPLVQTIQGNWYGENSNTKNSFAPPTPVPRETKTCCSPWILALIGLLALTGLLITILVGKQTSSGSQVSVTQTVPVGKVGSASPISLTTSVQTPNLSQSLNAPVSPAASSLPATSTATGVLGITSVTPISSGSSPNNNTSSTVKNPTSPSPTTASTASSSTTVSLPAASSELSRSSNSKVGASLPTPTASSSVPNQPSSSSSSTTSSMDISSSSNSKPLTLNSIPAPSPNNMSPTVKNPSSATSPNNNGSPTVNPSSTSPTTASVVPTATTASSSTTVSLPAAASSELSRSGNSKVGTSLPTPTASSSVPNQSSSPSISSVNISSSSNSKPPLPPNSIAAIEV